VPGLPLIRLDGSSTGKLLGIVNSVSDAGPVRQFFDRFMGPRIPWIQNVWVGAGYYLVTVLGVFAPLLLLAAGVQWRRLKNPLVSMPLLFALNFLVMALGLALDNRGVATPEELPHRPFVWMYFVVVTSVGALAGLALMQWQRARRISRPILLAIVVGLLAFPAIRGAHIQYMSALNTISYAPYPTDLFRLASYMATHGNPRDVFQDSAFDNTYTIAALSGRRAYVERTFVPLAPNQELENRVVAVGKLMQMPTEAAVRAEAQRLGIRWFVVRPDRSVAWPSAIVDHPAFVTDGYRLYRF
jgi:hypothetical protein